MANLQEVERSFPQIESKKIITMALTPRLNPYTRLTSRFYEALFLLSTLRPVNGPHVITKLDTSTLQGARRRFLRNIGILCDYQKGGDSTTSIAAEDRDDAYVLWVSSNEGPRDNVTNFILAVLNDLRRVVVEGEEQNVVAEELLLRTIQFVTPRLRKEKSILHRTARSCVEFIEADSPQHGKSRQPTDCTVWPSRNMSLTGLT